MRSTSSFRRRTIGRSLNSFELGIRLGVDSIWFQRLTNYGAYAEGAFAQADVASPAHPKHRELLDILRSPFMNHPAIVMDMLMPLLPEVVASDLRLPLLHHAPTQFVKLAA